MDGKASTEGVPLRALPDVSAVVLSYRRPNNVVRIVAGLLTVPCVKDILVFHNGPHPAPALIEDGRVRLVRSPENQYVYGRFVAMRSCRHHIVVTVDDDYLVRSWLTLIEAFARRPDRVTAGLTRGHYNANRNNVWGACHEVLLGFGSVLDRRWVEPTLAKYTDKFGYDEILHRKADRLFTMLLDRHHQVLRADVEELPGARDMETALYHRKDHYPLTKEARRRAWSILGIHREA